MVRLQSYFLCFVTISVTVKAFIVTPFEDSDEIKEQPLPLLLDAPKEGRFDIAAESKTLEIMKCLLESVRDPDAAAKILTHWIDLVKYYTAKMAEANLNLTIALNKENAALIEKKAALIEKKAAVIKEKAEENRNLSIALNTLRIENVNLRKYVLLLKVRSRIEDLEEKFLDPAKTKGKTRRQRWGIIFYDPIQSLKLPEELKLLRQRVPKIRQAGFIDTVVQLYRKCSNIGSNIAMYDVPYLWKWDAELVRQMLTVASIVPNEARIQTVVSLLTPLA